MAERRLIQACEDGDVEKLRELLAEGVDVNYSSIQGMRGFPLMVNALSEAFFYKFSADRDLQERADAAIELLLENGADPNLAGDSGYTVLHLAASCADTLGVRRLLDAGADPNVTIMYYFARGETPLHQLCIMHGRNLPKARWPLDYARVRKDIAVCARLLIQAGARVNERTARGCTPLSLVFHTSCISYDDADILLLRHECTEILVRAGADVNIAAPDGKSPLVHALKLGRRGLVKMYLRAGSAIPRLGPDTREEDAHALVKVVAAAGGWDEFVKKHTRVLACAVSKINNLPHDVARAVVEYWCPPGGY